MLQGNRNILVLIAFASIVVAQEAEPLVLPSVMARVSDDQLRRGYALPLEVTVTTGAAVRNFRFSPEARYGVCVVPAEATIASIPADSTQVRLFDIIGPTAWGRNVDCLDVAGIGGDQSRTNKQARYRPHISREPLSVVVNYSYETSDAGGKAIHKVGVAKTEPFRQVISMEVYIIFGLIGIMLGYLVKTMVAFRSAHTRKRASIGRAMAFGFLDRFDSLVVTVAIGFVAFMLLLDQLVVADWWQALCQGALLGLLSDDQLLQRVKPLDASNDSAVGQEGEQESAAHQPKREEAEETRAAAAHAGDRA